LRITLPPSVTVNCLLSVESKKYGLLLNFCQHVCRQFDVTNPSKCPHSHVTAKSHDNRNRTASAISCSNPPTTSMRNREHDYQREPLTMTMVKPDLMSSDSNTSSAVQWPSALSSSAAMYIRVSGKFSSCVAAAEPSCSGIISACCLRALARMENGRKNGCRCG